MKNKLTIIIEENWPSLIRMSYKVVGSEEDAKDIVQDVVVKA